MNSLEALTDQQQPENTAIYPPIPVSSFEQIYGQFGQDHILVVEKYPARKVATDCPHYIIRLGESYYADYLFSLDNDHGLTARIYGDGKIEIKLLSTTKEKKQVSFEELVQELDQLAERKDKPDYSVPST